VLGVINADTDTFVESIPTGENAHSVAADSKNNAIFVPLTAPNPACANGCIGVYQIK
jgi:DNA-binding beta-propeller fold protein YncE